MSSLMGFALEVCITDLLRPRHLVLNIAREYPTEEPESEPRGNSLHPIAGIGWILQQDCCTRPGLPGGSGKPRQFHGWQTDICLPAQTPSPGRPISSRSDLPPSL